MAYWFSSFLIAAGQVLAILLFFLYKEPDSFVRRPGRIVLTTVFFLVQWGLQAILYQYVNTNSTGSLPALQYIFITLVYYLVFTRHWSGLSWSVSGFIALIFMLIDNCIWPFLMGISRSMWGIGYLYEGNFLIRMLLFSCCGAWKGG